MQKVNLQILSFSGVCAGFPFVAVLMTNLHPMPKVLNSVTKKSKVQLFFSFSLIGKLRAFQINA